MNSLTKKIIIQALDCGAGSAVIVDAVKPHCPLVYVSPVFEELTGYDASELIGRPLGDLVKTQNVPVLSFEQGERIEQRWARKDGHALDLVFKVSPLYNRPGQPAYWLLSEWRHAQHVSGGESSDEALQAALNDAHVRLKRLERTDSVTGLVNRKTFLEILQRDWGIARRTLRSIAIIIFAVDDYDNYCEIFGRHAAESCLRKVAHAINGSLRRDTDVVARYDSQKFITLIGSADEGQAAELAARIADKVRKLSIHHPRSEVDRFITLSFGFASEIPDWTAPCSMLIETAEAGLLEFRTAATARVQNRAG
jgi:diguanylate cyclase (GGDEF)-like protein